MAVLSGGVQFALLTLRMLNPAYRRGGKHSAIRRSGQGPTATMKIEHSVMDFHGMIRQFYVSILASTATETWPHIQLSPHKHTS